MINNLSIYPNPSSGTFSINQFVTNVEIFSLTGQLVRTFQNKLENDVYEISDLKTGIYMVKVTDVNNNIATLKLIKK